MLPALGWAQVTTSNVEGRVTDDDGKAIEMVNVVLKHEPTGTVYVTTSRSDGRYNFDNVRVGGPYTLMATLMGYKEQKVVNIYLEIGNRASYNIKMYADRVELQEAVVTYNAAINTNKQGTETSISEVQINQMPTVNREIADFARITPQASVQNVGGQTAINVAGMNNRYNSIFIDGAVLVLQLLVLTVVKQVVHL